MSELKQSIAQLLIDNFKGTTAKRASDMAIAIMAFVNADREREIESAFCGTPGTGECSCRKFADNPLKCDNRRTQPEATKPAQNLSAAILALPEDEILQAFANAVGNERDGAKSCYVTTEEVVAFVKYHLAPLVSASPADALVAGDRMDAERTGTLYQAVQRAAGELPEGWTICLEIERDAGTVELIDPEGNRKLIDGNDGYLCQAVNEATNAAIQAQKDGHD